MIIASNPTAAIPMIKKANAAGSCSSQYLCTRIENFERPVSSSEITSQFAQHGADDVGIVVGPNTLVRVAFAD